MNDERDLIAAAQRDPRAFGPLYEAYAELVWRYVLRRLGDPERAADVTSTIFMQALSALPGFRPGDGEDDAFRRWLMTIARNAVISEWRRHRPTSPLDDDVAEGAGGDAESISPEALLIANDERERVRDALGHLSPVQRQIVEMRIGGWKSAEIAEALNMSVSAVNTAHFRAYARLRDLLRAPTSTNASSAERRRS